MSFKGWALLSGRCTMAFAERRCVCYLYNGFRGKAMRLLFNLHPLKGCTSYHHALGFKVWKTFPDCMSSIQMTKHWNLIYSNGNLEESASVDYMCLSIYVFSPTDSHETRSWIDEHFLTVRMTTVCATFIIWNASVGNLTGILLARWLQ